MTLWRGRLSGSTQQSSMTIEGGTGCSGGGGPAQVRPVAPRPGPAERQVGAPDSDRPGRRAAGSLGQKRDRRAAP
jgi:hypothetical protein